MTYVSDYASFTFYTMLHKQQLLKTNHHFLTYNSGFKNHC